MARVEHFFAYIGESSWRFGLAICVVSAIQIALILYAAAQFLHE